MAHLYLYCLVLLFFVVVVNGQYSEQYCHPKEYVKRSIQSPPSLISHPRDPDAHNHARAAASNTIFEPLVTDILQVADGDLSNILEIRLPGNVSAQCQQDFNEFMLNIQQPYAIQMLDATGKLPSGLFQGNIMWHGRFDQCRAVKADEQHDFNAQYCMTTLVSYRPTGSIFPYVQVGVCVPDSCSGHDVDLLITTGILETPLKLLSYYPYTVCAKDPEYSAGAIAALCIFSILGLLIIGGTGLETIKYLLKMIHTSSASSTHGVLEEDDGESVTPDTMVDSISSRIQNENAVDVPDSIQLVPSTTAQKSKVEMILNLCEKILMCFSALTNGRKILATQTAGPNSHLAALNGIRVISMFWVILGHTHVFIMSLVDNAVSAFNILQRFSFQAVANGTFSVDTFFVLSGMLVTFFALKELKKGNGRLNWGLFYFHRFWRLTPVYMLVIFMWTTLGPHFSNGPTYYTLYTPIPGQPPDQVSLCRDYWWTNLLYINNLYPKYLHLECIGWSWYLANDMQFYVISPIILYLLYRSWKIGFAVICALMAVCFTSNAVVAWKYDLSSSLVQPSFVENPVPNSDDFVYIKPWTRINSYLVGMMTGYMLYWVQGRSWRMPKIVTVLGWCYAVSTGFGIVYCLYGTYHGRYQTQAQAVFYYTVSRTLWSSAVAWVAFACATGYGGPVNTLLGWTAWGPLAKLTYCAYLLHPIIIFTYYLSSVIPIHYNDYNMIYLFIGNLVLAYSAAFVLSVCAEAPFMALEKLFLPKRGGAEKPKRSTVC